MPEYVTTEQFERLIHEEETHNKIYEAENLRLRDSIDRWRVQIQVKQDDLLTQMEKHEKKLYGNGEPGMDEQIRNIHNGIQLLMKLVWLMVGAVITFVTGGAIAGIVYFIRATGKVP